VSDGYISSDEREYFYIPDESGNDVKFEILYEHEDEESGYTYILLIPPLEREENDDDDDTLEVFPLRYKTSDEEPVYELVETDEEIEKLEGLINTLMEMDREVELEKDELYRDKDEGPLLDL
jgi:uncharacterized protein YrzB (UPF0473 family)